MLANSDDSASKETLLAAGWAEQEIGVEQLYDLTLDPNEMRNLVEDPAHAAVLGELRARLNAWMEETGDPLLDGPVPLPPGAVLNDPSQASPNDPLHTGSAA